MPHDQAYLLAEEKIKKTRFLQTPVLDLSNNWMTTDDKKLAELPDSLEELAQLEFLDLSYNRLTALPTSIGQLAQLQTLKLDHNQFTALPESLGQLTKLKELSISGNQITILPEWLGNFARLEVLSLNDNKVSTLPKSTIHLSQMRTLIISDNQLGEVPEPLKELYLLGSLRDLRLSGNGIRTIPEWAGRFWHLELLEIANNQLTGLPDSISELTSLTSLYLGTSGTEGNPITELPSCIRALRNLRVLWINGCALKTLPDWVGEITKLESLNLESNNINDIPPSIIQLEYLNELNLKNNPLNFELAEAYKRGIDGVKAYLRPKATFSRLVINKTTKLKEVQPKRKLKVFLCHASQDKGIVLELFEKFVAEGWIEPWLDAKKLLLGQDWQAEIKNAVETADNVIIFLSNTSINKDGFIQKELRLAKDIALEKTEGSVFLIPLRLDDCEVPRSLQIYQWADYYGSEKEQTYTRLLESLKFCLENIKHKEVYMK